MDILEQYILQQNDKYSKFPDRTEKCASIFIVIPCYNEPDVVTTLDSLSYCCYLGTSISVLVVVNDADDTSDAAVEQNNATLNTISQWQHLHKDLFFDVQRIYAHALSRKWAGVGWARKIGMDEAVRQMVKNKYSDGIIVSLDADSTVQPNYFQAIETAFDNNPSFNFFTIHFEHSFDNHDYNESISEGILRYEIHMRYFRNAMQWCGYPHAIHTVGSSFAFKASAYAKQGGMNRRKAGEDFYFLHKLVILGSYGNISSTTVFPASRQSDRVPFGTGAAIKKWIEGSTELDLTYSFESFISLKLLFTHASQFWQMEVAEIEEFFRNVSPSLQSFCKQSQTVNELLSLRDNCSNKKVFEKRLFHSLNAFWIIKYLNYAHEIYFKRVNLKTESILLLQYIGIQTENNIQLAEILNIFRNLDKRVENCC